MTQYGAIPTVYKGIRFRSRLEATWAALFDELRWPWEFEAIDLKGYIPDFLLTFEPRPVLVEVKPIWTLEAAAPHAERIIGAGWEDEAVVVGFAPMRLEAWPVPVLGWMRDVPDSDPIDFLYLWHAKQEGWGPGLLAGCSSHMGLGLYHAMLGQHCRVCERRRYLVPSWGDTDATTAVSAAWAAARNAVQWTPRA